MGTNALALAHAEPRPRFAAFLEAYAAFRHEVVIALCGPSFFEHRRKGQRAAQDLRDHESSDPAAFVELFAQANNAAGVVKRSIANVLSVFVAGRSVCGVCHGQTP